MADTGFPPIADRNAHVLILGSLPGQRSLAAREYYAHPQNAFWPIMRELVGAEGTYPERCAALARHGIALWDVLLASARAGSMDASIRLETSQANDFNSFFDAHAGITRVGFNGRKAAALFARLVPIALQDRIGKTTVLPSTSPAYAAMPFADKLEHWRTFIDD